MSENKFCTNCGAALRDEVQFCTECGTKVAPVATPVMQSSVTENSAQGVDPTLNQLPPEYAAPAYSQIPSDIQKAKNNKQGKLIAGVLGAIAVLIVIFIVYKGFFAYPSKPAEVAKKCFEAMMIDYDAKEAEKYVGLEVENDEIEELCDSIKDSGIKVKKISIVSTDIDEDYAEVTLSIKASWLGETSTEDGYVSLQKIDGKWKVIDFN